MKSSWAATDINRGSSPIFSNTAVEVLLTDPGAHEDFIRKEVEQPTDLVWAAVVLLPYLCL